MEGETGAGIHLRDQDAIQTRNGSSVAAVEAAGNRADVGFLKPKVIGLEVTFLCSLYKSNGVEDRVSPPNLFVSTGVTPLVIIFNRQSLGSLWQSRCTRYIDTQNACICAC